MIFFADCPLHDGIAPVSKIQLLLTSLVAVIPGAFLIYLLVMAMLFSEALPMIAYVVMGITLMAATATVLIPAGIFVGGNRGPRAPKAKKDAKGKAAETAPASEEVAVVEDASVAEDDDISLESSEFVVEDADDEFLDEGDVETEQVEELDSFEIDEVEDDLTGENDFDEIDFDDEPKPKKKR